MPWLTVVASAVVVVTLAGSGLLATALERSIRQVRAELRVIEQLRAAHALLRADLASTRDALDRSAPRSDVGLTRRAG